MIKLKSSIPLLKYISYMGIGWTLFRLKYAIQRKTGFFNRKNHKILKLKDELEQKYFFARVHLKCKIVNHDFTGNKSLLDKADKAKDGKIFSFSHEYYDYSNSDKNISWHYNPLNKKFSPTDIAWNKLADFGEYGDIKNIWEASRFPQVYFFVNAYAVTKDKSYAKSCIDQLIDWCAKNPFPFGVNYKCGQEISFRLFSWIVALNYFEDFISPSEKALFIENIYISLLRIDSNIDFARKAVKNNHSISESAGLFLGGLLFPEFPESKYFLNKGLKILRHELNYQVFEDGSYIQHSFNYQRLALDIVSFVIHIAKKMNFKLADDILNSHRKMLLFLYSFIQKDGRVPNYGTNDGAYLFPISILDYKDFRPSLNFATALSYGKYLFDKGRELTDLFAYFPAEKLIVDKQNSFPNGGYYILKDDNTFVFSRCHSYKTRPAQCDMLHVDIWYKGMNIFCDSGSFSYNSNIENIKDFKATIGHNTVKINDSDQMEQVLNFGWANWIKSKVLDYSQNHFIGEHYGYKKKFGIIHKREINLDKTVCVNDFISGVKTNTNIMQIWNTTCDKIEQIDEFTFSTNNYFISSNIPGRIENMMISDYYNEYHYSKRIIFETNSDKDIKIITKIKFNS